MMIVADDEPIMLLGWITAAVQIQRRPVTYLIYIVPLLYPQLLIRRAEAHCSLNMQREIVKYRGALKRLSYWDETMLFTNIYT